VLGGVNVHGPGSVVAMADDPTPFPAPGTELTHLHVVRDIERSTAWYRDVLGAELMREYGGSSAVFRFGVAWLLIVTGGGPTEDKPGVTFETPDPTSVSHSITIRVADCRATYETLVERGAEFLTPPHDWGHEIRCFFRDPDGHLFEISQA
jgi:catechol 2,3-dioxygenase-like lactoylglutathione lyase family enzyme